MLFAKPTIDFIVAGLGNPGAKYEHTRHNAGFDALDYAADKWGARVTKSKFDALTDVVTIRGKKVLLLKPQTFMNASGQAIGKACSFYKVPPERVIVLFDDISLPPGKLRLRKTGSGGRPQRHQVHHRGHRAGFSPRQDRRGGKAPPGLRSGRLGALETDRHGEKGRERALGRCARRGGNDSGR